MGEYIKLFSEHTDYTTYRNGNMVLPNVSYCSDTPNEVHYNPFTGAWLEVTYTISDISSATELLYNDQYTENNFTEMEVDGVKLNAITNTYQFNTTGTHVVKYKLTNPTELNIQGFSGYTEITAVKIPDTVITMTTGFPSTSITTLVIPDSVVFVGQYVAAYCPLTSVVFGSSVESAESAAVESTEQAYTITMKNPEPITLGSDPFFVNYDNLTHIYVPAEAVDTYKAASGWSAYSSIISAIPSNP